MKNPFGKHLRLTTVALGVGVGCLAGVLIPLPQQGEVPEIVTKSTRSRQGGSTSATGSLQVPETITSEWAVSCANSRPDEFFRWLIKADPQPSTEVVKVFFGAWIELDPDAAFRAALLLPARFGFNPDSRFFIVPLMETFRRDPLTGFRWAGRLEGVVMGAPDMGLDEESYEKFGKLDAEEVRTLLNRYPAGGVSSGMARTYALAFGDVNAALLWASDLNVEYQNAVFRKLVKRLTEEDPAAALEYIRTAPSNIRQHAGWEAFDVRSAPSLLEGIQWLAEEMGVSCYEGQYNLLSYLYFADPKAAQDYVESIGERDRRVAAVRGLAEAASDKPEDMTALIRGLPDDLQLEAADSFMRRRMPTWYLVFLERMNDGSIREANMEGYIHQLATHVESEVRPHWGINSEGTLVDSSHLPVFQNWMRDNPGPNRDRLIREAYKLHEDKQDVLDAAFKKVPADEMERILGEGGP